ncbi:MAG: hypothetical protein WKG01_26270 [Kofleriaceae bacterium]
MNEIPEIEAVTTGLRELARLAACLLPHVPAVPGVGILAVEQLRAASAMHEHLHVARRHVAFPERRATRSDRR